MESAQAVLQNCIHQDQTFSDAHILMAQILLHQDNYKAANQSLEVGLSYNFEVRRATFDLTLKFTSEFTSK